MPQTMQTQGRFDSSTRVAEVRRRLAGNTGDMQTPIEGGRKVLTVR